MDRTRLIARATTMLASILPLLAGPAALANDATFGGRGTDLFPLQETRVRMVSEEVVLEEQAGLAWHATATYRFSNPTRERVVVRVGYPETPCPTTSGCRGTGEFRDLVTEVRGVRVPMEVGRVGSGREWAQDVGRVHLFDLAFDPGETVTVVHRYDFDGSTSVDGREVHYLTRTGRLWNGPIGKARFVVRTLERPWGILFPDDYTLKTFAQARGAGGGPVTEMVFERSRWTPRQDLEVRLFNASAVGQCDPDLRRLGCPMSFLVGTFREAEDAGPLEEALRRLDDRQLRACREMVQAHRGYRFHEPDLRRLFYRPATRTACSMLDKDRGGCRCLAFAKDPGYKPELLAPDEAFWIEAIRREESRRRGGSPTAPAGSPPDPRAR
jgi:hypothetical protein